MKIAIIYSAYNTQEYLAKSLDAWIYARANKLDGHEFKIFAISIPFDNFKHSNPDDTGFELESFRLNGMIDSVHFSDNPMKETESRQLGLKDALEWGADICWQHDSDEFITIAQISNIIKYIESDEYVSSFRLCLKNFVFDDSQYLQDAFTPMRIHRVNTPYGKLSGFYDDNNCFYIKGGDKIRDTDLATKTVPRKIAWIAHLTWLNNERSKRKIEYQTARGWKCSFAWDDSQGGLVFNKEFYRAQGLPLPKVISFFELKDLTAKT